jgi:hypothetical protein
MKIDRTKHVVQGEIFCIEFHDACVDALVVHMDDTSTLHFAHLPVYHQRAPEKFELWSYRAAIEFTGVQRVVVDGAAGDADYVSVAVGFDDNGLINSGRIPVDQRVPLSGIKLQFGSGRKAEIACSEMRLILEEAIEYVEDWIGPL